MIQYMNIEIKTQEPAVAISGALTLTFMVTFFQGQMIFKKRNPSRCESLFVEHMCISWNICVSALGQIQNW